MVENKTFDEITVGDHASMERSLTMKEVELFAVVSGDLNPLHRLWPMISLLTRVSWTTSSL